MTRRVLVWVWFLINCGRRWRQASIQRSDIDRTEPQEALWRSYSSQASSDTPQVSPTISSIWFQSFSTGKNRHTISPPMLTRMENLSQIVFPSYFQAFKVRVPPFWHILVFRRSQLSKNTHVIHVSYSPPVTQYSMYKANFDGSKLTCKSPHHYRNIVDDFYTAIVTIRQDCIFP